MFRKTVMIIIVLKIITTHSAGNSISEYELPGVRAFTLTLAKKLSFFQISSNLEQIFHPSLMLGNYWGHHKPPHIYVAGKKNCKKTFSSLISLTLSKLVKKNKSNIKNYLTIKHIYVINYYII